MDVLQGDSPVLVEDGLDGVIGAAHRRTRDQADLLRVEPADDENLVLQPDSIRILTNRLGEYCLREHLHPDRSLR